MKYTAKLQSPFIFNGIQWVIIEIEPDGTAFAFFHKDLREPCIFDQWYENSSLAKNNLLLQYGVKETDWTSENTDS